MVDFLQRSGLLSPRFENVSMDPNAPQDVNPTGITVKDYAHRENTDGIPLDELRDLLGVKQQTFLAETTDRETEWRYRANGGYTASLYEHSPTSQIIHVSDFLRVTCTRNYLVGGVPTTDTWVFRTNSDNWFSLTPAAAGDTLVSEMTGILLRSEGPDNDYVPATIYIGRTEDNEILIQTETLILPINHPEARMTVRFEFETYAGGLLGRRIAELRAFNPQHRLVFKRNSNAPLTDADVPATTDITYDGQTITIAASLRLGARLRRRPLWLRHALLCSDHGILRSSLRDLDCQCRLAHILDSPSGHERRLRDPVLRKRKLCSTSSTGRRR